MTISSPKSSGKKRQSKATAAQPPKKHRSPKPTAAPEPSKPSEINPFELSGLVIRPAYKNPTGMITSPSAIPVRDKAGPATFFMTHPDPEYAQELYTLKWSDNDDGKDGEIYLVHPNIARIIEDDPLLKPAKIYYCISQTGGEFLAVVPTSSEHYDTKHAVFEAARSRFLKMRWVKGVGQWVSTYAEKENDSSPETPPSWTEETYQSILLRGFNSVKQDRYIRTADHYVIKALRGIRPS
jgi:hypothetical protein